MRKLKGVKETRKQKDERRKDHERIKQQVNTIVIPVLIVVVTIICFYVYINSRPEPEEAVSMDYDDDFVY